MFRILTMNDEMYDIFRDHALEEKDLIAGHYRIEMNDKASSAIIYHDTIVETDRTILDNTELRLIKTDDGYDIIKYNMRCHSKTHSVAVVSCQPDLVVNKKFGDTTRMLNRKLDLEKIYDYVGELSKDKKTLLAYITMARPIINIKHNRYYKPIAIVLGCTNGFEGQYKVIYEREGMLFERELKQFIDKFRVCKSDAYLETK